MFASSARARSGCEPFDVFSDKEPNDFLLKVGPEVTTKSIGDRFLIRHKISNVLLKRALSSFLARLALRNNYRLVVICEDVDLF